MKTYKTILRRLLGSKIAEIALSNRVKKKGGTTGISRPLGNIFFCLYRKRCGMLEPKYDHQKVESGKRKENEGC